MLFSKNIMPTKEILAKPALDGCDRSYFFSAFATLVLLGSL